MSESDDDNFSRDGMNVQRHLKQPYVTATCDAIRVSVLIQS